MSDYGITMLQIEKNYRTESTTAYYLLLVPKGRDHMRQTLFIHSALFTVHIKVNYLYKSVPVISSIWYLHCVFVTSAYAFPKPLSLRLESHFEVSLICLGMVCVGAYWYKIHDICEIAFSKSSIISCSAIVFERTT